MDVLAAPADLQRLAVVALALADVAGHVNVGKKMHLDLDEAVTLAGLAAATLDVEAEAAWIVAAGPRLGDFRKNLAKRAEQAGVRGRVGAWRATDRALVDVDDAIDFFQPADFVAGR